MTGAVKRADVPAAPGARLGERLIAAGALTTEALAAALGRQRSSGARLGEVLRAHGLASDDALTQALAAQAALPVADLAAEPPAPELATAERLGAVAAFRALPWRAEATGDPAGADEPPAAPDRRPPSAYERRLRDALAAGAETPGPAAGTTDIVPARPRPRLAATDGARTDPAPEGWIRGVPDLPPPPRPPRRAATATTPAAGPSPTTRRWRPGAPRPRGAPAGVRLVFATPEPEAVSRDLPALRRAFGLAPDAPVGLAMCSPAAFDAARLALTPDARAARAAARTPRRLSAIGLVRPGARAAYAMVGLALIAAAAAAPDVALPLLFLAALAANAVNIVLRLVMMALPPPAPPSPAPSALRRAGGGPELAPSISVLVALYREPEVAGRLVRRLAALDWPRERLEVLLALEADDDVTAAAIAAADPPPWMRIIPAPPGGPRTKPRALNHALDFARGAIIGVYDAEDAPDPGQLRAAAAAFAAGPPRLACVQARLGFRNAGDGWIARCFAIEYATWFRLVLPGLARLGAPLPLGGSSLFVRRRALEALGGWDAWNVTEDADLGIRLARAGYLTALIDSETAEEAVRRPLAWIRQRSRWQKGYLFTWLCHMRTPLRLLRDLGPRGFLMMQAHFVGAAAAFLSLPLLWSAWAWWTLVGVGPAATLLAGPAGLALLGVLHLGQAVVVASTWAALGRAGRRDLRPWALTLPAYWPLATLSAFKGLAEAIAAPSWWDKTTHGQEADPTACDPPPAPMGGADTNA